MLREKPNGELFELYRSELALTIRNERNLKRYYQVLDSFRDFLDDIPPSTLLAKQFLNQWTKSKPSTLHKYVGIIRGFMNWYGEDLDIKVKLPHELPEYVEDADVYKLIDSLSDKRSHRNTICRDALLIEFGYKSGLRRGELAGLKVRDVLISERAVIVRKGKGGKDRTVPLTSDIIAKLAAYLQNRKPDESIFGLTEGTISDKIRRVARKAGVKIHTHSFRHGYATRLLEKGANIKVVQELLGHSRLSTTEGYLSLLPHHLREAVDLLEDNHEDKPGSTPIDTQHGYPERAQVSNTANKQGNIKPPSSRTIAEGESSLLFDKKIFSASDKIMNERELRDFLLGLEVHRSYRSLQYIKVARFWEFIELEGNKYTDPELRQLQNNLTTVLEGLVLFSNDQFSADAKVKRKEDLEFHLDPAGLRYLRDDNAKAKMIAEVENQLDERIKAARDSYKAYRAGIRDRLYS